MLDIKFIRENPEKVQKSAKDKGIDVDVNHVLEIDAKFRELSLSVQKLREERNSNSSNIKGKPTDAQLGKGRKLKESLEKEESALSAVEQELNQWLLKIPNSAKDDVKLGKSDTENEVIKTVGKPTKFDFTPLDHLDLGEKLGIIDVRSASKVSGARFAYLKGDAVMLEFALIQFGLETLIKEGFTPVVPPVLVTKEIMQGLGYMENGGQEDMYHLEIDDMYLVGTAEHALVPMHKDEILKAKDLPKRYVGFSTAFRREAGSYGKDTKGILRVHQFDKLEMVSFVKDGEDKQFDEHGTLLSDVVYAAGEVDHTIK